MINQSLSRFFVILAII